MTRIKSRLIAILLSGLIYSGCLRQEPSQPVAEESQEKVSQLEGQAVLPQEAGEREISQRDLPLNLYGRDDPFALPGLESTTLIKRKKEGLNLEGIMYDPLQPLAMINGRIVKQGDEISGRSVVKIEMRSVTLEDARGKTDVLRLF